MTEKLVSGATAGQGLSAPTERTLAVLELLGGEPDSSFSLAEICRRLAISRATGHAILTTLAAREWAVRDPSTSRYSWGPAVTALGRPTATQLCRGRLQELSGEIGTQVSLARRDGNTLIVIDTVGECPAGPRIWRGMRTPYVAPIGRDYAAWSDPEAQSRWLQSIGTPAPEFQTRMSAVFGEIRRRGYVVERLTGQYVRVYNALRELSANGEVDEITAQLARAYADLAVIDILDEELSGDSDYRIATVSAPVRNPDGAAVMTVMASVFATMPGPAIRRLGDRVRRTAAEVELQLTRFPDIATA